MPSSRDDHRKCFPRGSPDSSCFRFCATPRRTPPIARHPILGTTQRISADVVNYLLQARLREVSMHRFMGQGSATPWCAGRTDSSSLIWPCRGEDALASSSLGSCALRSFTSACTPNSIRCLAWQLATRGHHPQVQPVCSIDYQYGSDAATASRHRV